MGWALYCQKIGQVAWVRMLGARGAMNLRKIPVPQIGTRWPRAHTHTRRTPQANEATEQAKTRANQALSMPLEYIARPARAHHDHAPPPHSNKSAPSSADCPPEPVDPLRVGVTTCCYDPK